MTRICFYELFLINQNKNAEYLIPIMQAMIMQIYKVCEGYIEFNTEQTKHKKPRKTKQFSK